MSDFEHSASPELELSQESLAQLRDELAKVLIVHGKPGDYTDVYPTDNHKQPYEFSYPLEPEFLKRIYFPNNDDVVVEEGEISYFTAHKLEKDSLDEDSVEQGIYMVIKSRLPDPSLPPAAHIQMDTSVRIGGFKSDEHLAGYVDTEYSQAGKFISPNTVERSPKKFSELTIEELRALFEERVALRHNLMLEDAEKLAQVADYIESQPKID